MRWMLAASFVIATLAAPSAFAQAVHKCTDATGRTTYTNTPCAHDKLDGQLLMKERPLSVRIEEHMQHLDAVDAKRERQRAEKQRESMLAQERFNQRAMARSAAAADRANAPTQKSGIDESISVFAQPKTRAQRGLPSASPAPTNITHCAGGTCYDNQGGVYHGHDNGITSTGPSGGTCVQTGDRLECY